MGTDLSRLESLDTLSRIDFTSQVEGKWLDFANEIASGNPSFGVGSNVRSWLVAADMLQDKEWMLRESIRTAEVARRCSRIANFTDVTAVFPRIGNRNDTLMEITKAAAALKSLIGGDWFSGHGNGYGQEDYNRGDIVSMWKSGSVTRAYLSGELTTSHKNRHVISRTVFAILIPSQIHVHEGCHRVVATCFREGEKLGVPVVWIGG